MKAKQIVIYSIIATIMIEVVCIIFRYVFDLTATENTRDSVGRLTLGLRIHHGYIGIVMLAFLPLVYRWRRPKLFGAFVVVAVSLIASDLIHHFAVLLLLEGDPHFDITY